MKSKKNASKISLKKLAIKAGIYGLLLLTAIIALLVLLIRIGAFGKLPNELDLKQVKNNTATEVFSVDNELIGRYYYQNRTNAAFNEVPQNFIEALVATEDVRFYKHKGVDFRSTMRVLVKSIILRNSAGGGSTISQQLAKNLFPREQHGIFTLPVAKLKEIFIARRLEKIYPKEEILIMYLNTVSFGENTYGIETAALVYFSKKPKDLKLEESAVLVGLLKANTSYNPRIHKEAALLRRNTVLNQMARYDYITEESADSLKEIPIRLKYRKLSHNDGPAPYMREHLRQQVKEILKDSKKPDGSEYNLYADGLKVYTTINFKMQRYAEESVKEHLTKLQKIFDRHWRGKEPWKKNLRVAELQIKQSKRYKSLVASGKSHSQAIEEMKKKHKTEIFGHKGNADTLISSLDSVLHHFKTLQSGVLVMNAFNGDILAWVGGTNYKFFKYDHVTSKRQVGSTFKPLVYAAAVERGVSPCKFYANDSVVYEGYDDWTPQNSDGKYGGYYSVKGALANSVNTVSVKLILEAGIDSTIDLARSAGIKSKLPEVPSLSLGTGEVSLYEMVQAYCAILNRGHPVAPRLIRRIEDAQGNIIYTDPAHTLGDTIISKTTAQKVIAMMQGTVNRGTATSLRTVYGLRNELAGKTGTTQNQTDGWFIGMNPNIVAGVWVGGDNPAVRFRTITYGQGGYSAMPIYARFMKKLYKDPLYKYLYNASFNIPEEIYSELDCEDFTEEAPEEFIDIEKLKEKGVGELIRNIFGRKKRKDKKRKRNQEPEINEHEEFED